MEQTLNGVLTVQELINTLEQVGDKEAQIRVYTDGDPYIIELIDDSFSDNHRVDLNIAKRP